MNSEKHIRSLELEIKRLKKKIDALNAANILKAKSTVKVPASVKPVFDKAEKTVGKYFSSLKMNPGKGTILINGERYVLVRASALSLELINSFVSFYKDHGKAEALSIGKHMLFDISHILGLEDARNFHQKMDLKDPVSKLSAGPVHFAYSGWAFVDIKESNPTADENFFMKFDHPFSFEADSWVKAGKKSDTPVCIMNAGYSSGWCEASFGIPLTTVEINCKAKGDKCCTFIMAPPERIEHYLTDKTISGRKKTVNVPSFLERKKIDEKIKSSLREKEVLLREIHHRVKNNLQIISSLLNLQADKIEDLSARGKYVESIGRIKSMAIIHEMLYRSKNMSTIVIDEYLKELIDFISRTYNLDHKVKLELKFNLIDKNTDINHAIPLGIIINELLSNAFKYAFTKSKKGLISIECSSSKKQFMIFLCDNGGGMSEKINLKDPQTLGLQLVYSLVEQLDGKIKVDSKKGVSFLITFPI